MVPKESLRHTRLLPVICPPGTSSHCEPFQYWASKAVIPYCVKVIVAVGGLGAAKLSCTVNTSISLIGCDPLNVISTESGKIPCVPSFQPPLPAPQPAPLRSPSLTLLTGKAEL